MKKIILLAVLASFASTTWADSFWKHNGSLMRLVDSGNERTFIYERPSEKMLSAGVVKGIVLFDGYKSGNKYFGTSRAFSENCYFGLTYKVSGNVYSGPKVVLTGNRAEYNTDCTATGAIVTDKLVFTYAYSE